MSEETLSAFRTVPRTGVIYVTTEASKRGFQSGAADWCNLGQGQPETGPIEGSPPRVGSVSVNVDDLEYAQWKIWVGTVSDVDLAPFLELVGEKRP